jgi:protein-S-isoprenylcysteine O-methyltransferase Ste14
VTTTYFVNTAEQIVFCCIIAVDALCEFAIRIYSEFNSYRSCSQSKRSDSGSIFIVVLGLVGNICLSFFLASNTMPICIKQLKLPHIFYFIGIILIIAGLVLRVLSVLTLRKYFTVTVQTIKDHQLIQSGVYKHLRNPSYTGLLLISVGVAFSLCNLIAIICSMFIFTIFLNVRIKVEEKVLREQFKKEFDEYCSKTYRLIPFIW